MTDLYDELEFPARAEYLDQYENYQVDIAHWKELAEQFKKAFRQVYARRSAAVLLVHGPQGSGKSMFSTRLSQDYERTKRGESKPDLRNNLWHLLVATDSPDEQAIENATRHAVFKLVDEHKTQNWLEELRGFVKSDDSRVRVIVCDDMHKDSMLRPWTEMSPKEFYEARQAGPDAVLAHLAERLNDACRHDFQRTLFVMLSNDRAWLDKLHGHLERWYEGLSIVLALPVPKPPTLERIVRINTNRLNRVSYWYCLDAAHAKQRQKVRKVLMEGSGFTSSFYAVSQSLDAQSRRQGRPGNPNTLTLVTLGSEFAEVETFLNDREIEAEPGYADTPRHLGVWEVRGPWASKVVRQRDRDFLRRARMLESEFMLRWVSLDMAATYALLQPPTPGDPGEGLMQFILRRPSIATPTETREAWRLECTTLDTRLDTLLHTSTEEVEKLTEDFKRLGQRRSTVYEPAIRVRAGLTSNFGRGFAAYKSLKPDLIAMDAGPPKYGEYTVCALTSAPPEDAEDLAGAPTSASPEDAEGLADAPTSASLKDALRRTGHSVEFTAFLRENLDGLESYLRDKIERYTAMLESV
ncbi:hypothetical protein [Chondromyces crocatus]|uniref:Uncharacterized protein n=1 Tax=Chondromyces crocatus TaxID=52 RepID=A0A0K1EMC9_CHOCO|nr:hypothetical protein [Chondromyces crocatus]AKT41778.1 uncharacterized protein CMC5_059890 [Chondromyces crocatus]